MYVHSTKKKMGRFPSPLPPPLSFSPGDDDDEVHDVPHVPEVAARVEDEPLRQDLEAGLHGEDAQEVRLGHFLRTQPTLASQW